MKDLFIPSTVQIFGPMKKALRGQCIFNDNEMKEVICTLLRKQSINFYETGIHALIQKWDTTIEKERDYVKG